MKTPASTASRLAAASALVALLSASLPLASAADLTWATNAAGSWNTSTTTAWNPGPVAWNNANNDTAIFGGSAATYTVSIATGTAISAGGLSVTTGNNVTLNSGGAGSSLTLAGAEPTIGGTGNTTLSIALQGANGLIKTGSGTLRLNVAATYSGDTVLNNDNGNGQITLGVTNGLSTTTKLTTESGTNFTMQGFSQTLAGLAGNGTVRTTSGSTSKVTINGGTTDTFTGSINDGATVGVALGFERAGTGTTNLNGTSAYRGTTTVSGGTLSLGSNLSGTASVTVTGGTLASSVANVNLGTGAVTMTGGALSANGASIGTFTLASGQNFTATLATLNFTLGASNTSDQIIGSGLFDLNNITLALSGNTSVAGTYTLFSGFTGSNVVTDVTITGLDAGLTGVLGTNGILTVSAIPEPSIYAALAGAAGLAFASLRRRSRG
ncbi:MAG TPA: autotransporter-associated beta strand repeat-containing protein [Rariglobus sp.]